MSITIQLSADELAELKEVTGKDDPAEAVKTAVAEHIRWKRRMEITKLAGRIEFQPGWEEMYGREAANGAEPESRD